MTLAQKLESAAEIVKGRAWGVDIGKPRVYLFCTRRDAKVFIDFPKHTDDKLGPVSLKCSIADNGWHGGRWYFSQKEIILEQYTRHYSAIKAFLAGDEDKARAIMGKKPVTRVILKKRKETVHAERA